jgi:hypothetical protein
MNPLGHKTHRILREIRAAKTPLAAAALALELPDGAWLTGLAVMDKDPRGLTRKERNAFEKVMKTP